MTDLQLKEIKKEYEKIKDKYNLPDFNLLNAEFEFKPMQVDSSVIKHIARRMGEKVVYFSRGIDAVLFSFGNSLVLSYENKMLDEEEKKKIIELHKRIMFFDRGIWVLDIEENEEEDIKYIKELWKEWFDLKKEVLEYAKKIRDGWKKEYSNEKSGDYFG